MWLKTGNWDWIIPVTLSEFLVTKNSSPLSVYNLLNKLFLQKKTTKTALEEIKFYSNNPCPYMNR